MSANRKYTGGMWVYGQIIDRYATDGYNKPKATLDVVKDAKESGLSGIDINYPWPEKDLSPKELKFALDSAGLEAVCITPSIYSRKYRSGSFSSSDEKIRKDARDLADESVDVANQMGAKYVKFWPGQDGYDYPFQVDYSELRKYGLGGIRDIAKNHPKTQFAIEYKLKEPRTRLLWSTANASLINIAEVGVDNLGLVIDFGHSLFAKENPAEVLSLIHSQGRLVDIELCDNYREWDDDLSAGAIHLVETLEFLYIVKKIGWDSPLKLDLFPYRESPISAVIESIATLRKLEACVDRLDFQKLNAAQKQHDAMAVQSIIRDALIK